MAAGTKNRINRAYQAKQKLLYRQEAYREISSKLVSFNDKYLAFSAGSKINILSNSFFNSSTIKSTSDYVSVSGHEEKIQDFKITGVSSVATNANFTSADSISNKTIKARAISSFTVSNSTMTVDLNGVKITAIVQKTIRNKII